MLGRHCVGKEPCPSPCPNPNPSQARNGLENVPRELFLGSRHTREENQFRPVTDAVRKVEESVCIGCSVCPDISVSKSVSESVPGPVPAPFRAQELRKTHNALGVVPTKNRFNFALLRSELALHEGAGRERAARIWGFEGEG